MFFERPYPSSVQPLCRFLHYILAVLQLFFNLFLGPLSPEGVPGEGPDYHFLKAIGGFGPIPARIRGAN